ncbi:hypothetical protein SAMN05216203_0181 [Marinobacter daqiaonensis]|uniref:DUF2459 domain-containing protein n=1 Tax=Marinobacter daqiaonensis TaxID=650891 RepID=A0A1I6GJV2_9GAMM|nr:hypothetical protein [Marinobacter daqiaonensis]SFR42436.1 hypothetical protein SAMN05216203_0181 [Marinobacter daqiaonensis]
MALLNLEWLQVVTAVRRVRPVHLAIVVAAISGCANHVTVPEDPASPVQAYLVNHGRHASLVLPDPDGQWRRYVHGEWRWYALDETGPLRAMQAILWPTQATIGRGTLDRSPETGRPLPGIPEGYAEAIGFQVSQSRVTALRDRLDAYFENPEKRHYQPRYGLEFVPFPKDYWFMHQSNEVIAHWLRALGLEVRGPTLFSDWKFR